VKSDNLEKIAFGEDVLIAFLRWYNVSDQLPANISQTRRPSGPQQVSTVGPGGGRGREKLRDVWRNLYGPDYFQGWKRAIIHQ
jgi:hypothetical protein